MRGWKGGRGSYTNSPKLLSGSFFLLIYVTCVPFFHFFANKTKIINKTATQKLRCGQKSIIFFLHLLHCCATRNLTRTNFSFILVFLGSEMELDKTDQKCDSRDWAPKKTHMNREYIWCWHTYIFFAVIYAHACERPFLPAANFFLVFFVLSQNNFVLATC
jgi:hypothetical protein